MRTEIDNIKQSNESISKDLSEKNDKLFKIRDHVNSRNEKIKQEIEERFHEFQTKISDLQNTYVSWFTHYRITRIQTEIDQSATENFKTQISSLKENQGKIFRDIEALNQEKADKKMMLDETKQINKTLKKHTYVLEDHHNHSLTIENFMEKYIPIKIQSQISETMKSVLDKKAKKNLEAFNTHKFEQLHSAILEDDGNPAIHEQIKRLSVAIESLSSGNSKLISSSKTLPSNTILLFNKIQCIKGLLSGSSDRASCHLRRPLSIKVSS